MPRLQTLLRWHFRKTRENCGCPCTVLKLIMPLLIPLDRSSLHHEVLDNISDLVVPLNLPAPQLRSWSGPFYPKSHILYTLMLHALHMVPGNHQPAAAWSILPPAPSIKLILSPFQTTAPVSCNCGQRQLLLRFTSSVWPVYMCTSAR